MILFCGELRGELLEELQEETRDFDNNETSSLDFFFFFFLASRMMGERGLFGGLEFFLAGGSARGFILVLLRL